MPFGDFFFLRNFITNRVDLTEKHFLTASVFQARKGKIVLYFYCILKKTLVNSSACLPDILSSDRHFLTALSSEYLPAGADKPR